MRQILIYDGKERIGMKKILVFTAAVTAMLLSGAAASAEATYGDSMIQRALRYGELLLPLANYKIPTSP